MLLIPGRLGCLKPRGTKIVFRPLHLGGVKVFFANKPNALTTMKIYILLLPAKTRAKGVSGAFGPSGIRKLNCEMLKHKSLDLVHILLLDALCVGVAERDVRSKELRKF